MTRDGESIHLVDAYREPGDLHGHDVLPRRSDGPATAATPPAPASAGRRRVRLATRRTVPRHAGHRQFSPPLGSRRLEPLCDPAGVGLVVRIYPWTQQEALSVDEEVTLASAALLAGLVSALLPLSVVLTDWLSRIAVLRVGESPLLTRTVPTGWR